MTARRHLTTTSVALANGRLVSAGLLISLCALTISVNARAEGARDGDRALPALGHIALARPNPAGRIAAAGTLGFGMTEAQGVGDGLHERLSSRLALSAYAARWLAFGVQGDGRYDKHPADAHGADQGWLFQGAITSRANVDLGAFQLGVEAVAWAPGGPDVGTSFRAVGLDSLLLLSHSSDSFSLAAELGYRLDRSAVAARNAPELRHGARIALGASDFDAVLAGLGGSYDLGRNELFGEVSADLLVGRGAPAISESPLRLTAGARRALAGKSLSAELMLDVLLSGRPEVSPSAPLIPIEPRVALSFGIRYRFGQKNQESRSAEPSSSPTEPPPTVAELPSEATLSLTLIDDQGQPLDNASVELIVDDRHLPFQPNGPGRYRLSHAPAGPARLHVHSDGRDDVEHDLKVETGASQNLVVKTDALLPAGQVRGLVRSFRGTALAAKVRVEPGGQETSTDHGGFFQIDVTPGDYEVVIDAAGYVEQRRKTHVEKQGVVVVNADLSKKQ